MNVSDAEAVARQWLDKRIKLKYCSGDKVPRTFYIINAEEHHVFIVQDPHDLRVGGDHYVAVHKVDGSFRDLGTQGE